MKRPRTNYIVVHCAATPPTLDIGVAEIRKWHTDPPPEGRGWSDIGYHFVIRRNGNIETGRPHATQGAHVAGYNAESVGICLVGGVDATHKPSPNYTEAQWIALRALVHAMTIEYPNAEVLGHRDFPNVAKACPSFAVKPWWINALADIEDM